MAFFFVQCPGLLIMAARFLAQNPKHFSESKNTSQNPKRFRRIRNRSQNPKHIPESGFWKVLLNSGTCFGFREVFLDSGKCFGFWDVFLDSGKCFVLTSHRSITSFEVVKVCGIRFSIWESFIGFYICCYPITTILECSFSVGIRISGKKKLC